MEAIRSDLGGMDNDRRVLCQKVGGRSHKWVGVWKKRQKACARKPGSQGNDSAATGEPREATPRAESVYQEVLACSLSSLSHSWGIASDKVGTKDTEQGFWPRRKNLRGR